MPRTKKPRPRQSSLISGCTLDPAGLRYLEVLESQLQESLHAALAAEKAAVEQVCRRADMWYNDILRTVPMEVLIQPLTRADLEYREPYIPDAASVAVSLASSSSGFSSAASTSTERKPSTVTQTRRRVGVAASAKSKRVVAKKKASPLGSGSSSSAKPAKVARKASTASHGFHTPLARTRAARRSLPVVTPKFDIRKRPPASARAARQGEVLLSLSGSPIASKQAPALLPVHVHLDGGQVVKLKAESSNDDSVKQLCRAIQQYCGRKK
ncbi:uncharacterized protein LOC144152968 [Haemaphysalis longicornis]